MKNRFPLLALSILLFTATLAQVKKDSTPNKRYPPNIKVKPIATTKAGKPDLRYKMNKKAKP